MMKKSIYLLLGACFVFTECERQQENNREVLRKLDAISGALNKGVISVRWATANKSQITTAIYQWSREKMEQGKKAEALPPETEAKISEYEGLRMELLRMQMPMPLRVFRNAYDSPRPEPSAAEREHEAMSKRVAEAKAPVAAIVDRRERQAAEYRQQYSVERLVAEYVKDRYDLVVDSQEKVLYQTAGEITDITGGVLALFKEKTNQ